MRSTGSNSNYNKLAVQCLNHADSYLDCASYQVQWWQIVLSPQPPTSCSCKILNELNQYHFSDHSKIWAVHRYGN